MKEETTKTSPPATANSKKRSERVLLVSTLVWRKQVMQCKKIERSWLLPQPTAVGPFFVLDPATPLRQKLLQPSQQQKQQ